MKDKNFELISVAEDTGGEEAAGEWFDRAKATYTQLIDEKHIVSSIFNMVNVPTGVWIDEDGYIVRPNETAYTSDIQFKVGAKTLQSKGTRYVAALKDWVEKGADSEFALSRDEVVGRTAPRTSVQAIAETSFQLGVYFHGQGDETRANMYWEKAQELRPEDWNYHRQEWSFTPKQASANWSKKFRALGDQDYYAPLDLPEAGDD